MKTRIWQGFPNQAIKVRIQFTFTGKSKSYIYLKYSNFSFVELIKR